MDNQSNNDANQQNNNKKENHSVRFNFFPQKMTIKNWLAEAVIFLILFIIQRILELDLLGVIMLVITFLCSQLFFYVHIKPIKLILLVSALISLIYSINRFVESFSISGQKELTEKFQQQIDDPISEILLFLVRKEPNGSNTTISDIKIGIEFQCLHAFVRVPDESAKLLPQFQTGIWGSTTISTYDTTDLMFNAYPLRQMTVSDTFFIPLLTLGLKGFTFSKVRDLQGTYFHFYIKEDLIPLIKECYVVVNKWIIYKMNFPEIKWRHSFIEWQKRTKEGKFASLLIQFDLHNITPVYFHEWKPNLNNF